MGQRRVCLMMSTRSAQSLLGVFKRGGSKDVRSWSDVKGKVFTRAVDGVGDTEMVDLPLNRPNIKFFRAMLEERPGCAYAVTNAPMVQLEMSGGREATKKELQEAFGVTLPFEGGRVGAPNQVIEFARGDNNVGSCGSLVEDVPLGARMLVAMAKANRVGRRKLRVWNDPVERKEKLEVALSLKQSVWVTKDGLSPSSSSSSESSSSPSPSPSPSPASSSSSSKKKNGGGSDGTGAPAKKEWRGLVYTPANSVSASIVYQGNNRHVYAVASGVIQLPQGNAISEGVTVFPVGHDWLSLALLCSGVAAADLRIPISRGLDDKQVKRAVDFAEAFWTTSSPHEPFSERDTDGFKARLREIFQDLKHAGGGNPAKEGNGKLPEKDAAGPTEADRAKTAGGGGGGGTVSRARKGAKATNGYSGGSAPLLRATVVAAKAEAEDAPSPRFLVGDGCASDYRGSPLAILKEDAGLWRLGEREPSSVRKAAGEVGEAAVAAAIPAPAAAPAAMGAESAAEMAAASTPAAAAAAAADVEMSPRLGRALMRWSDALAEAGRDMGSLMGLQAVVMAILSVHRRNALAGARGASGGERGAGGAPVSEGDLTAKAEGGEAEGGEGSGRGETESRESDGGDAVGVSREEPAATEAVGTSAGERARRIRHGR
ncbi:unnamed protein product, partial [Scytosiphon promiscuus]